MPPQGASHLLRAAGALSRQKGRATERAESRCPCAPWCSPPICSILCQDGHVLTIKIYLKICGRPSKFADQNLRWHGSKHLWFGPPGPLSLKTKTISKTAKISLRERHSARAALTSCGDMTYVCAETPNTALKTLEKHPLLRSRLAFHEAVS